MLEKIMEMNLLLYFMGALGIFGITGMFMTHLTYRRKIKNTDKIRNIKEKWLTLWKTRDRLLCVMDCFVWYPSIFSTGILAISVWYTLRLEAGEGISLMYLYVGTTVPVVLLLFRRALDFAYKEELVMGSLSDYLDQMKEWMDTIPSDMQRNTELQDDVVEKIASSIRQTAATGSHFRKMLSPEEEEIMKEIIREFMV